MSLINNGSEDASDIERGSRFDRSMRSSSDHLIPKTPTPKDRYRQVWLSFAILGVTTLVPWNFFITATDYWMYKFRDVSVSSQQERTSLQTFFESYLAIAANFPMLIAMLLTTLFGQRVDLNYRLKLPLFVILTVFILTTIFAVLNTDRVQTLFFIVTIIMVTLVSFFSAVFQSALFGFVANFPESCMHAVVIGQGISGLFAALLRIFTLLIKTGSTTSGIWYFMSSSMFVFFAIIVFWFMDTDFTRYYLRSKTTEQEQVAELSESQLDGGFTDVERVIKSCWPMAFTTILSFASTLAVFPAISVLIVPANPDPNDIISGELYTPIVTFLLFNAADLAGRFCSNFLPFPSGRPKTLMTLGILRLIFPLLIIFCNVNPKKITPVLFKHDLYYPIFITLTSLTNGYLFSSAMILASTGAEKRYREITGFVMTFSLGLGLFSGALISFVLLRII